MCTLLVCDTDFIYFTCLISNTPYCFMKIKKRTHKIIYIYICKYIGFQNHILVVEPNMYESVCVHVYFCTSVLLYLKPELYTSLPTDLRCHYFNSLSLKDFVLNFAMPACNKQRGYPIEMWTYIITFHCQIIHENTSNFKCTKHKF